MPLFNIVLKLCTKTHVYILTLDLKNENSFTPSLEERYLFLEEYAVFREEFIQCCFFTNEVHSALKNGFLFQRNMYSFNKLISKKYQHNRRLVRNKH